MERDMASIIFSAKDIFEQEFGREVRGYSKAEVDEFLDDVIKDYETYAALVKSLRQDKGQKSMPLGYIRENGYRIEPGAFPQIPYLDVIKEHLLGGKTR